MQIEHSTSLVLSPIGVGMVTKNAFLPFGKKLGGAHLRASARVLRRSLGLEVALVVGLFPALRWSTPFEFFGDPLTHCALI